MKKYLLDTNIISYLDKPDTPEFTKVINSLSKLNVDDTLNISILSLFEYQRSISSINDETKKRALVKSKTKILETFNIENLQLNQELIFAELNQQYQKNTGINRQAIKRHSFDLVIASQAIHDDMILVSNDSIFKTISEIRDDFKYENWLN